MIRNCPEYSDYDHVMSAVSRAIENTTSGREWTQQSGGQLDRATGVGEFFDALKSSRRTKIRTH